MTTVDSIAAAYRVRVLAVFQRLFIAMATRGLALVRFVENPRRGSWTATFELPGPVAAYAEYRSIAVDLDIRRSEDHDADKGKVNFSLTAQPMTGIPSDYRERVSHQGWCKLDDADEIERSFREVEDHDFGRLAARCLRWIKSPVEPKCAVGGCWEATVEGTGFCALGPSHRLKKYLARWIHEGVLSHVQRDTLENIIAVCKASGRKATLVDEQSYVLGYVYPDGCVMWGPDQGT